MLAISQRLRALEVSLGGNGALQTVLKIYLVKEEFKARQYE